VEEQWVAASSGYRVGSDNSVLRSVLYDLWDYKCYWCSRPKDYNDVQIDHIIPQSAEGERLQQLVKQFGLPVDFDVHDARNLAPICSQCNGKGGKGDQDLIHLPVVLTRLRKAEKLRSTVRKKVETFADPGKAAAALIVVKEAQLSDHRTKQAFAEHGPAVVQKLVLLDEASATDFVSFRTAEVQVGDAPPLEVGVSLNVGARRAVTVLEDVCGGTLEGLLQEPVAGLYRQIHGDTQTTFEAIEGPAGPTNAGPPVSNFARIDVDSVVFQRTGSFFEFTIEGDFEASLSASLVQDSADGGELAELQGDAYVTGRYSLIASWDSEDGGDVEAGEPWIDSWASDVYTLP
jgi:hypothetical protein